MQLHSIKSLLKTGVLETACLTGALLLYGSCLGVIHAHSNISPSEAIQRGDQQTLRSLLKDGADPNAKDSKGTPLLMSAVLYGNADTVRLLLNYGADPDATNAAGATALIWAAGDPLKAEMLIQYGANVNAKSALGRTPLLVAAPTDGAGSVVQTLIAKGADTSAKDVLKGNPKLMTGGGGAPAIVEAAKARDGVALRTLLRDPHIDVNAKDANGGTALTESVINGHYENVQALLAAGASIDVQVSMAGYTPLTLAAMRDDERMLALLLKAGAAVNDSDASGTTPLMWAAYAAETNPSEAVAMLLRAGADTKAENRKGETALSLAKWHGKTYTVLQLLRADAHQHKSY